MPTKTQAKAKVKRVEVRPLAGAHRDPVAVSPKFKRPGYSYRWAGAGPGADPSELEARIEELEERGYTVVMDPEKGGPVKRRGAVLMEIDQKTYDRGQRAKVEANMASNRAQAQSNAAAIRQRLRGQGRIIGAEFTKETPEPLLSENEQFTNPE